MSHERESASTLSPPSTAPMRRVCYQEKEQDRCIEQFYLTVQLAAAWSELLTTSEGDKLGENASFCDPDKVMMQRQENTVRSASAVVCAVLSAYRAFRTEVTSAEDSGRYSNARIVLDLVATRYEWRPLVDQVRSVNGSRADPPGKVERLPCPG